MGAGGDGGFVPAVVFMPAENGGGVFIGDARAGVFQMGLIAKDLGEGVEEEGMCVVGGDVGNEVEEGVDGHAEAGEDGTASGFPVVVEEGGDVGALFGVKEGGEDVVGVLVEEVFRGHREGLGSRV